MREKLSGTQGGSSRSRHDPDTIQSPSRHDQAGQAGVLIKPERVDKITNTRLRGQSQSGLLQRNETSSARVDQSSPNVKCFAGIP